MTRGNTENRAAFARVGACIGGLALLAGCQFHGYTTPIPNDPFNGEIDHRISSDTRNTPPITMENAAISSLPLSTGFFSIPVPLAFPVGSTKDENSVVSVNPKENPEQEQIVAVAVQPVENSDSKIVPITVSPRQGDSNAKPDTYFVAVLGGQADLTFQANPTCQKLSVVGGDLADIEEIYAGVRNSFPVEFLGFNTAAVSDAAVNYLDKFLKDTSHPKRVYSVTCDGRPAANFMIMAEPYKEQPVSEKLFGVGLQPLTR